MNLRTFSETLTRFLSPEAFRHAVELRDRLATLAPKEAATALVLALISLITAQKLKRDDVLEIFRVALGVLEEQKRAEETPPPEESSL